LTSCFSSVSFPSIAPSPLSFPLSLLTQQYPLTVCRYLNLNLNLNLNLQQCSRAKERDEDRA
jgi:hypothetical protein